jgi:chitinase
VPTPGAKPFAPYIDLGFNPSLVQTQTASAIKYFTMAFMVDGGGCTANWGGSAAISSDTTFKGYVDTIRANGGDVIFSFGGASGDNLPTSGTLKGSNDGPGLDLAFSNACTNVTTLTEAYQAVIDHYHANPANHTIFLDFDVEGNAVNTDPNNGFTRIPTDKVDSVDIRNRALAALVNNNPGITINISYTLGVAPSGGLPPDQASVLENAINNSTSISLVNIMTFDFGPGTPIMAGSYGPVVQKAANDTLAQLAAAPLSRLNAKLGITTMIGVNDTMNEVFGISDAQNVEKYATPNAGIARLSFWSVARDNGSCAGTTTAQSTCSGIAQDAWDFSHVFEAF